MARLAQVAFALLAIALIVIVRSGPAATSQRGIELAAISQLTPAQLKAAAADKLEGLTAKGGRGFRFEIVQSSRIVARAGGPQVSIPDPSDPHRSLGLADSYDLGTLIESGFVTPDGFFSEMRSGPEPGQAPDFKNGEVKMSALAKGAKVWRSEGEGWYATDLPPGIGLDPRTAALLPSLLRNAADPSDGGMDTIDGKAVRRVAAVGRLSDVPGVVAADGAAFTRLLEPLQFAVDATGSLVELRAVAQNENLTDFDLVVTTTISFDYQSSVPALPDPSPAFIAPTPAPEN